MVKKRNRITSVVLAIMIVVALSLSNSVVAKAATVYNFSAISTYLAREGSDAVSIDGSSPTVTSDVSGNAAIIKVTAPSGYEFTAVTSNITITANYSGYPWGTPALTSTSVVNGVIEIVLDESGATTFNDDVPQGSTLNVIFASSSDYSYQAAYAPVTNITGVPTTATAGTDLTLTGTVAPSNATNQTIVWSVKNAGATGASITGSGSTLSTTAAGTVVLTATITNGLTASSNYTQDFTITVSNPFVAVTNITGVPTTATAGTDLTLTGTVAPSNATNQSIVWSVKNAGATGASITGSGSTLSTTAAGTVVLTATITNGLTASTDYTQDFSITVSAASTPTITAVSANPTTIVTAGGTSAITVTGTNLSAGITVTAFDSGGTATAITGTTDASGNVTLTFPANTSTTDNKVYTIKASLDGGTTWVTATATVTVMKNAPTHADPDKDTITKGSGISGSGTAADPFVVTEGNTFTITLTGDRQNAPGNVVGDTQLIPESWSINPSGTFPYGGPYVISAKIDNPGNYTLTVVYRQYEWNGASWQSTNVTDSKTASVRVDAKSNPTPTPDPEQPASTPTTTGGAPQTGDNSNLGMWLLLLIASMAILATGAIYVVKTRAKRNTQDN